MNNGNALATQPVSRDEWQIMLEQAGALVKSGFLPKDVSTAEKATAIILKGRELNVPPMHALSTIVVIQGKPTVSPELMAALVERDYGPQALIVEETTDSACVVSCWKPGWNRRREVTFTIEDAKRAGLLGNQTWQKYPDAMLRSRAISKACKTYFQASIGGMYTSEEMGAIVNADGDVVDVPSAPSLPSIQRAPVVREIEQPPAEVVTDDGEIIEAPSFTPRLSDEDDGWITRIEEAQSQPELAKLGNAMLKAGIRGSTHPARVALKARMSEISESIMLGVG